MLKEIPWAFIVLAVFCGASPYYNSESIEPEYLDRLLETGKYGKFSKALGISSVDLVKPSKDDSIKKYPRHNTKLYMGDILLTPQQNEMARQGKNFTREPRSRWPFNSVPYVLSSNFTRRTRKAVEAAINRWNTRVGSCVRWRLRTLERHYVYFFPGDGCFSNIGRTPSESPQPLSIDNDGGCDDLNTVLHEMEHTIGIDHEHVRSDRDEYVTVLWENIPKNFTDQYEKQKPGEGILLGTYDYYSIMHYTYLAPITRKPAFEILEEGIDLDLIGDSPEFTKKDIRKIQQLYRCNRFLSDFLE